MTRPSLFQRWAFAFGWWVRGIPVLLLIAACAPVKRCEFPLWVTVTPDADGECRALPNAPKWKDMGGSISDTDTILGCAPENRIITNGTESNMGHEMAHQVERNCL